MARLPTRIFRSRSSPTYGARQRRLIPSLPAPPKKSISTMGGFLRWRLLGRLLLLLNLPLLASATPSQTLKLSCLASDGSSAAAYLEQLYNRALEPLDYQVELISMDSATAIKMLKARRVDGTCARDKEFVQLTGLRHLIPLEHSSLTTTIFGIKVRHNPISSERQNISLGFYKGFRKSAMEFRKMGFKSLSGHESIAALFDSLKTRRVDLIALPDSFFLEYQKQQDSQDLTIHEVLYTQPGYAHLSDTHRELIKPFSRRLALVASQSDNYYKSITRDTPIVDNKTMVFSCATKPYGKTYRTFERIATQAFASIGYNFKLIPLSRAREQAELEQGRIDGACGRTKTYMRDINSNAVIIDAPLSNDSIVILSNQNQRKILSLNDFTPGDRIAFIQGTHSIAKLLAPLKKRWIQANDLNQGLLMVSEGQAEFLVDFQYAIIEHLEKLPMNNSIYTAGRFNSPQFFPVIHKKHADIVPALTAEFRKLIEATGQQDMLNH